MLRKNLTFTNNNNKLFSFSIRLIPNTYEMVYTYSRDYERALLPWPPWVAKVKLMELHSSTSQ